jgi:hypothetical protein
MDYTWLKVGKYIEGGGWNFPTEEFKYARINAGDYSFRRRESWQHQPSKHPINVYVQKCKDFKVGGVGFHTCRSWRNALGLLRNAVFTNTPRILALMPATDNGSLWSVETAFPALHSDKTPLTSSSQPGLTLEGTKPLQIALRLADAYYQFTLMRHADSRCYQPACSCGNTVAVLLYWLEIAVLPYTQN